MTARTSLAIIAVLASLLVACGDDTDAAKFMGEGHVLPSETAICEERQEVLEEAHNTILLTAAEAGLVLVGEGETQMFQFAENAPQILDRLEGDLESSSVDLLPHRLDSISDGILAEQTEAIDDAVSALRLAIVQISGAVAAGDLLALEEPMLSVQLTLTQLQGVPTSIEAGC